MDAVAATQDKHSSNANFIDVVEKLPERRAVSVNLPITESQAEALLASHKHDVLQRMSQHHQLSSFPSSSSSSGSDNFSDSESSPGSTDCYMSDPVLPLSESKLAEHQQQQEVVSPTTYLREVFAQRCWEWDTWYAQKLSSTADSSPSSHNAAAAVSSTAATACASTRLQGPSWNSRDEMMKNMVDRNDVEGLTDLLSKGFNVNAHNCFGDSILHKACRAANLEIVALLVENSAEVHIADESGKTPLHDAFWAPQPNFALIDILMRRDPSLILALDRFKATPLDYVNKRHWTRTIEYLKSVQDTYWPPRNNLWKFGMPFGCN